MENKQVREKTREKGDDLRIIFDIAGQSLE
jgi:hypothetical protein